MLKAQVAAAYPKVDWSGVVCVGCDELNVRKGRHYVRVFCDLIGKRVLFATPGKDKAVWQSFVAEMDRHNGHPRAITEVSIDMSRERVDFGAGAGRWGRGPDPGGILPGSWRDPSGKLAGTFLDGSGTVQGRFGDGSRTIRGRFGGEARSDQAGEPGGAGEPGDGAEPAHRRLKTAVSCRERVDFEAGATGGGLGRRTGRRSAGGGGASIQAEQAEHEAKVARRAEAAASGKPPRGRGPQAPDPAPQPKDQVNITDPESQIMKTKDGCQQAYNARAGVETAIVGPRVSQPANDKRELLPDVAAVRSHALPETLLVGSGFVSEAAVTAVELATPGLTILAALQREAHGRTVAQWEKRSDPPAPPPEAPFAERMRHRTATTAGRALYKLRQQTVEPVLGIIKEVLGFRRFCLRGLAKVTLEWELACLAYNCQRLHRLSAALRRV